MPDFRPKTPLFLRFNFLVNRWHGHREFVNGPVAQFPWTTWDTLQSSETGRFRASICLTRTQYGSQLDKDADRAVLMPP
jgi:hypothetical protein